MKKYSYYLILLFIFVRCTGNEDNRGIPILVKSGEFDRLNTLVKFSLPPQIKSGQLVLEGESGKIIPVQVHSNTAYFILDSLKVGEERRFRLIPANENKEAELQINDDGQRLDFAILNKPIFSYQYQAQLPEPDIDSVYLRDGYIHPLYSPTEILLTNDYPSNHRHHHGIWSAWTKTEFQGRTPDFWNMAAQTGTVKFSSLDSTWAGNTHAGFISQHDYIDLSGEEPVSALNETWKVIVHGLPAYENYYLFDLEVTQQCATDYPLILPEYRYGGVGFRGHNQWEGAENCYFLTSEGKDRSNGHATKARWCHIGGYVNDQFSGVAILDHPDNFRAPQPMRIHPGEPFFNYAPSQGGDWQINPGDTYQAKYRYLIFDGEPDAEYIDRFWNDYANPVEVQLLK